MKDGRGKEGKIVAEAEKKFWWTAFRLILFVSVAVAVTVYFWSESEEITPEKVLQSNVGGCLEVAKALKIRAYKRAERIHRRNLRRREEQYPELPTTRIEALDYYIPVYPCMAKERVGRWREGGKWVCGAERLDGASVVYSVGSNGDCTFERDLFEVCNGCQIHVFDSKLSGKEKRKVLKAEDDGVLRYHQYGITGVANATAHTKTLKTVMRKLKHSYVDIFKVDCEGCEWELFKEVLDGSSEVLWGQVQVALHDFDNMSLLNPFMTSMEEHGYRIFQAEQNWRWRAGIEFAFIHETAIKP